MREKEIRPIAPAVLTVAIKVILQQELPTSLDKLTARNLAEWFVEDFDGELVPLATEDPEWAVDIAEEVIEPDRAVVINKLRVAEELNRHFDEWL